MGENCPMPARFNAMAVTLMLFLGLPGLVGCGEGGSAPSEAVAAANSPPRLLSPLEYNHEEGALLVVALVAEDDEGDAIRFTLASGLDSALFGIDAEGQLQFNAAPDFEAPNDSDRDNRYRLVIVLSDGKQSVDYELLITITDLTEYLLLKGGSEQRAISQVVQEETVQREYWLRSASEPKQSDYPILIFLHGAGGNGRVMLNDERVIELIEGDQWVGVFPSGIDGRWNSNGETDADDVDFIRRILLDLEAFESLSKAAVYGVGFSNGASMINRLGKETDIFVAIATIASQQIKELSVLDAPAPPSVFQINGELDPIIPTEGGIGFGDFEYLSAMESAQNWADQNSCSGSWDEQKVYWGDYEVRSKEQVDCVAGRRVGAYVVLGAGHTTRFGPDFNVFTLISSLFLDLPNP